MRNAVIAILTCLACVAEKPRAISQPQEVVLSGTATDCEDRARILVSEVRVGAFDPDRNPGMLKLLRAMDSVDANKEGGMQKLGDMYAEVLRFADTATAFSRDTSEVGGGFTLRSPSRDSVLLIAYGEVEDDTFYYEYEMVGAQTSSQITLDMSNCNLAPDAPLYVHPSDSVPVLEVGLKCAPDTLRQGDTLSLVMPVPHGQELAVLNPSGKWFYLIQRNLSAAHRVIRSDSFRTIATFRIPADVRALVAGGGTLEPVFADSGKYHIFMGEQLSSNKGETIAGCMFTFK